MTNTTDPQRPEVDDPRVLALATARQQLAHRNPFNAVCPPWDGLSEQEQHLSLLDARSYLHAAMNAGLVPDATAAVSSSGRAALFHETAAADALVADARRAVHESLIHLAAPEADRVRALIADLETAVEGRTAIRMADGPRRVAAEEQPAETQEPETEEQTVRAHVLALHQIGEQLAGIETWMWEHLADVRDAERPVVGEQPDTQEAS